MTRKERLQWEGRRSKRRTWCHGAFCLCSSRKNAHVRAHFVRRQIPPILVFLDGKNISSCSILLPHFCVFQQNVPRKAFPRYPSVKKLGGLVCQLVPLFVFYLVVALANIVAWPVLLGAFSPVQWEAYKEKHRRSHKTYGRAWNTRCHTGVTEVSIGLYGALARLAELEVLGLKTLWLIQLIKLVSCYLAALLRFGLVFPGVFFYPKSSKSSKTWEQSSWQREDMEELTEQGWTYPRQGSSSPLSLWTSSNFETANWTLGKLENRKTSVALLAS